MSGTYLVCDLCGNYGPPAGFLFKDGVRLCYACYFVETKNAPTPADRPIDSALLGEGDPAPLADKGRPK